jgi:hypothetical protein
MFLAGGFHSRTVTSIMYVHNIMQSFVKTVGSRDSSVGIASDCVLELDGRCFILHNAQSGSEANPASYPMGKGRLFP